MAGCIDCAALEHTDSAVPNPVEDKKGREVRYEAALERMLTASRSSRTHRTVDLLEQSIRPHSAYCMQSYYEEKVIQTTDVCMVTAETCARGFRRGTQSLNR
jgi:hypothetical protein